METDHTRDVWRMAVWNGYRRLFSSSTAFEWSTACCLCVSREQKKAARSHEKLRWACPRGFKIKFSPGTCQTFKRNKVQRSHPVVYVLIAMKSESVGSRKSFDTRYVAVETYVTRHIPRCRGRCCLCKRQSRDVSIRTRASRRPSASACLLRMMTCGFNTMLAVVARPSGRNRLNS